MEKLNVDDWQSRLIGLATDGCSAMRGRKDGFAARLQREMSALTTVHCVSHRLQLSVLDATKEVSYLSEKFESMLKLFNFYHYSS